MELPDKKRLQDAYFYYADARWGIVKELETRLELAFSKLIPTPSVKGRVKDFDSYYKKYIKLLKQGDPPVITDIIGIRVVCYFIANIQEAQDIIGSCFDIIDVEEKGSNYSYKEFGYESIHLLITIPQDILENHENSASTVAEIQLRTILQDSWAEVEHELVYKAEFTPFDMPMKRKLASVNAMLSLADTIFQEIRDYQQQLHAESGKRREDFFHKLEENVDTFLYNDVEVADEARAYTLWEQNKTDANIDELLLQALYAHNGKNFKSAIGLYTRILAMHPKDDIISIIYNHRGMANFAQSFYDEAVEDFSKALDYDNSAYKAAYYRGLVKLVQRKWEEAVNDFTLSLTINPYQPFCLYRRGHANYHNGDKIQALSDCEAALLLMPEFEDALKFKKFILSKTDIGSV
jgi:putative GTP pyrophosphokinase